MKKLLLFAGIGCLSVVLLVVIGLAGTMAWAVYQARQLGDPTPTRVERTIPVGGTAASRVAEGTTGDALALDIDLREGSFTIQPGPPGSDVTVEGVYAEGYYELTESREPPDGSRGGRVSIAFRPSASVLVRAVTGMLSGSGSRSTALTVSIPRDLPVDLSLRLGLGEARVDLGGLALTGLDLDLSMGDHRLDFSSPVTGEIAEAQLRFNMGNLTVDNLGNARIRRLDASGSMGSVRADLGGAWGDGTETELTFRQSMGDLQLRVPRAVRLDVEAQSTTGQNIVQPADPPEDPAAPTIRVRLNTSMAESRVTRY